MIVHGDRVVVIDNIDDHYIGKRGKIVGQIEPTFHNDFQYIVLLDDGYQEAFLSEELEVEN
jgi:hypothetical protein